MASLQAVIWQILRDKSDAKLEVATLPQFKHGATPEVAISMIPTASQGFFGMLMQIIILVFWAGRCSNRYIGWATVKFLFVLFLFNVIFIHICYVLPISVNKDVYSQTAQREILNFISYDGWPHSAKAETRLTNCLGSLTPAWVASRQHRRNQTASGWQ